MMEKTSAQAQFERTSLTGGVVADRGFLARSLDRVGMPVLYIDNDRRCRYVNSAFALWAGLAISSILEKPIQEISVSSGLKRAKALIDEALQGKDVRFEEYIEASSGKRSLMLQHFCSPDRDTAGVIQGCIYTIEASPQASTKNKKDETIGAGSYFQNLIKELPVAIYTTDKDGFITLYNEAAEQLWGKRAEIGKDRWNGAFKIFKSDGITPVSLEASPIAISLKEQRAVEGEEIIIERADGTRKNVLPHPRPLFDEGGQLVGAINMLLDVTESSKAEEYKSRLAAIVQGSEDVIISKTTEGIVTSWNPAAERLYGYKEEEMIGKPISMLIPPDRINEESEILDRIKRGERVEPFETKRMAKDGRLIDVSVTISPIKDQAGNVVGASKIAQDITRRIEDRRLIHENAERLRMAGESAGLGIWEFHPKTGKIIWSEECEKIYGLSASDEPDREFFEACHHPDDQPHMQQEVLKAMHPDNDGKFSIEYRIYRASDHELRWLKVQGKVHFDEQESPQRFIGTMLDITDEKKANQLIRESDERFRMAVESTQLGTWEYQPTTEKLHWSDECRKIFNVPDDVEIDFNFFIDHIHPEDKDSTEKAIKRAMDPEGDGNYDNQHRIVRYSDHQSRWIHSRGKVYFSHGVPDRFIGTVLDITKEKQQHEELEDSVELFRTMADNVPAMIWMSGTDKFDDYFNRTWLEFTGRTIDEERNEGWLDGVHPEDVEKCISTYNESLKDETAFYTEYRLRRYDGKYRWIADNSVPRFSPDGTFLGFISACIDIDDQKMFREKLLESELLFKTISSTSPAALWMTDQNQQNIFVNNTWLLWTANSFTNQLDNGWFSAILEEDREQVVTAFNNSFNERKKFSAGFRIPRSDGSIRWCLSEGKPYFDIAGTFAGYAGSITDVTQLKALEQRKDDFIKMASHELKTPITSINGYVQLLLNIYNESEAGRLHMSKATVRSALGTIAKQVTKLTRLISELLDLSRIESGKLELHCDYFDLNAIVEETVEDLRQTTAKHAIIVDSSFVGKIYGDKDRLGQVLINLLNNAVKYSPESDRIDVNVVRQGSHASVTIKDYGIGIEKKEQKKIFERFYRVEGKTEQTYPGFGIGLFIVNEIVQRHGGNIEVNSDRGKGAEFIINLPLDYRK